MSELKITNLYKRYGNIEILKDVNLDIKSGEFIVFVGPSGCGKSTLLKLISGLLPPTTGEIHEVPGVLIKPTSARTHTLTWKKGGKERVLGAWAAGELDETLAAITAAPVVAESEQDAA